MISKLLFLIIWCFCLHTQAQNEIKGRVVDQLTNTPLENANVFITNTTKGVRTSTDGSFILYDVPSGKYEVVISYIGYETVVYNYTAAQLPLNLLVKMNRKVNQEAAVEIRPFEKDGWQKWGAYFLKNYIGDTENSKNCNILNKDVIRFRFSKKDNILTVDAKDIVEIENKNLGYKIKHQLEEFTIDFNTKAVQVLGYPYFEELDKDASKRKLKKYTKARRKAYLGSTMHLMRSIYRDSVIQEGFRIHDFKKVRNTEKDRIQAIVKQYMTAKLKAGDAIIVSKEGVPDEIGTADTVAYYRKVLKQPANFDIRGAELKAKDILKNDSSNAEEKILSFTNDLYVEYLKEAPDPNYYLNNFGTPKSSTQNTRLFFTDEKERKVTIYYNGSFHHPLAIFLEGYLGFEKMAEMLPMDYMLNN